MKKMVLVSQEELDRLRQKKLQQYNPTLRTMAFMDEDIEEILNNDHLTPEQKITLYQTARHRMRALTPRQTQEQVLPAMKESNTAPTNAPAQPNPQQAPPDPRLMQSLKNISKSGIQNATSLISIISANPNLLSINERNQLVHKGNAIDGSNASDLIHSLYSSSKHLNLRGIDQFLSGLHDMNVPSTLINNTIIRSKYNPQIGTGRIKLKSKHKKRNRPHPPGIPIKVLRIY